jgi:hypothetical protein
VKKARWQQAFAMAGSAWALDQPQLNFQSAAKHLAQKYVHFLDSCGGVGRHHQQVIR